MKISKLFTKIGAFFLLTASLVGCNGKLKLTADKNVIGVGESLQLKVQYSDKSAKFVYSSSDGSVATVTDSGIVKGIADGEATITAKLAKGDASADFKLRVDSNINLSSENYGDRLASTPYTISTIEGDAKYGLSDGGNVGVNLDNYYDLISVNESNFDFVYKYEDVTLSEVKDIFTSATELNAYYIFSTLINKAKSKSNGTNKILIKLPKDTVLDISSTLYSTAKTFYLENLKNVTILGDNTTFNLVAVNLDWKGFMQVSSCENLSIKGINVDNELPSAITGELTAIDVDTLKATVKLYPEFNNVAKALIAREGLGTKVQLMEYLEFNKQTKGPVPFGNCFDQGSFSGKGYTISGNDNDGYTMVVSFAKTISETRLGCDVILSFTEYGQYNASETSAGFNISQGNDITLEDINLWHAAGMGLVGAEVTNFFVNKFNVTLEPNSKSLMTVTADAMHFDKCRGKVEVTNCVIENSHDDALNMKHGYWYRLNSVNSSARQIVCSKMTGTIDPIVGDKLAIFDENSFEPHNPATGYYTIEAITGSTSQYTITVDKRLSNTAAWGNNCRVTFVTRAPEFKFANNIVRNKRNRGILVQVPNAVVENNTFQNVGHGSIQAACAMDVFNECTIPQNLTIKNNKFINNICLSTEPGYGDVNVFCLSAQPAVAPKGTLYGTVIENNFFTNNGNAAIALRGTGDTSIKDNYFYECCSRVVSGEMYNALLYASNAGNVTMDGNYNKYTLDKGMSGVILADLTTKDDVHILETNSNIKFYQSSKSGAEVDIAKATGAITFDGNLADWEGIGATEIEMIGCSDAKSNELTFEEIADHFKVNKVLMTHLTDGIALAFDVYDNELDFKTVNDFWTGDCIEVFFSDVLDLPTSDMKNYKADGAVCQMAFSPTWSNSNYCTIAKDRSNPDYVHKEAELTVKFGTKADGYTAEILLPYSTFPGLKTSIDAGKRIGISTIIADCSRKMGAKSPKDYERVQVGNVPHFVENYKLKTEMMPLYLFN